MIFWKTHKLVSCPVIIREACSRRRWEQMQGPTARNYAKSQLEVFIGFLPLMLEETPWKGGKKYCKSQRGWKTSGEHDPLNQLSKVHMRLQRLKHQAWGQQGSTSCFCGIPNNGNGCVSYILNSLVTLSLLSLSHLVHPQYESFCLVLGTFICDVWLLSLGDLHLSEGKQGGVNLRE